MIRKTSNSSNNSGKTSPSREISHQAPGCRKEFAQASRNRTAVTKFRVMNSRRVKFLRRAICPKLQIFFVCSPFQNLFFLVRKEAVTLLVDLVQDLVDPLLGHIGYLFEGLGPGNLIIKLILGRPCPSFFFRVEEIVHPFEHPVYPDSA